jgi:hypothetical protein
MKIKSALVELVAELKQQFNEAVKKNDFQRIYKLASYLEALTEKGVAKVKKEVKKAAKAIESVPKKHRGRPPKAKPVMPAKAPKPAAPKKPAAAKKGKQKTGAKLSVKYKGTVYTIEALKKGYSYNGQDYTSLSQVVDQIAGKGAKQGKHLREIKRWKVVE